VPLDPIVDAMLKQIVKANGPAITDIPPNEARATFYAEELSKVLEN
jgi:hypothetical protein